MNDFDTNISTTIRRPYIAHQQAVFEFRRRVYGLAVAAAARGEGRACKSRKRVKHYFVSLSGSDLPGGGGGSTLPMIFLTLRVSVDLGSWGGRF